MMNDNDKDQRPQQFINFYTLKKHAGRKYLRYTEITGIIGKPAKEK